MLIKLLFVIMIGNTPVISIEQYTSMNECTKQLLTKIELVSKADVSVLSYGCLLNVKEDQVFEM